MAVNNDGIWEITFNRFDLLIAPLISALVGSVICFLGWSFFAIDFHDNPNDLNFGALAIFLVGLLILSLSIWGLLGNIRRTMTVLREKQLILIADRILFKKTYEQVISFAQVQDVYLIGTKGDYGTEINDEYGGSYDVHIKLKTGEQISLFKGVLFSGKDVMKKRYDKLRQYLNL